MRRMWIGREVVVAGLPPLARVSLKKCPSFEKHSFKNIELRKLFWLNCYNNILLNFQAFSKLKLFFEMQKL